jgi:parvulin-like peptidyl-prolyl isomerase
VRRAALLLVSSFALLLVVAACGGGEESGVVGTTSAAPQPPPTSSEVPPDAIALVNGEKVLKADFDALIGQAEKSYELQEREFPVAGTAEFEAIKNQAVQLLVQRIQYEQEAERLGIAVTDADVEQRLEELKQQVFGGDDAAYQKSLEEQGYTEEMVLADVRATVIAERLYEVITKDIAVTDADIQAYYDEHPDQFQIENRDVRHILVEKKAKAEELYAELESGADFAALAKEFSQDPGSKDNGGEYEYVQKGQFVAEFDKYLFSADTNKLSKPIKTTFGWHLIQPLSEIRSSLPLEQVEAQIRQQLEQELQSEAATKWLEGLRDRYEGKIVYAVGYAPPPPAPEEEQGGAETGAATAASE